VCAWTADQGQWTLAERKMLGWLQQQDWLGEKKTWVNWIFGIAKSHSFDKYRNFSHHKFRRKNFHLRESSSELAVWSITSFLGPHQTSIKSISGRV
jgi:hypothetical protein